MKYSNEEIFLNNLNGTMIGIQGDIDRIQANEKPLDRYNTGYIEALNHAMNELDKLVRIYLSMTKSRIDKSTNTGLRLVKNEKA